MTIGPYHAIGSSIGFPDTRRNRINLVCQNRARVRGVAERAEASEHVSKSVPRRLDLESLSLSWFDGDIEVTRISCHRFWLDDLSHWAK